MQTTSNGSVFAAEELAMSTVRVAVSCRCDWKNAVPCAEFKVLMEVSVGFRAFLTCIDCREVQDQKNFWLNYDGDGEDQRNLAGRDHMRMLFRRS